MATMTPVADGHHGAEADTSPTPPADMERPAGPLKDEVVEVSKFWVVMLGAFLLVTGVAYVAAKLVSGG
ncbi:MAG: hypothetical protein ACR2PO_05480 [Methyloligellaceae bacterium]